LVVAPEPRTWVFSCVRTFVRRLTVFSRNGHSGRHAADCRALRLTQGPSFRHLARHSSGAICMQFGSFSSLCTPFIAYSLVFLFRRLASRETVRARTCSCLFCRCPAGRAVKLGYYCSGCLFLWLLPQSPAPGFVRVFAPSCADLRFSLALASTPPRSRLPGAPPHSRAFFPTPRLSQ